MINQSFDASNPIKAKSHLKDGITDILLALQRVEPAMYLAWGDTKARYRRSVLGPFWLVITTAISVAGLGFLWSLLLKQEPSELVPSLTVGLVIWQFVAACISEGPSIFIRNAHFIKNISIPNFFFPMTLLLRQLINFGHNFIVVIAVLAIFPPHISMIQLLIIPGLILVIGNLAWIVLLLAMLGSRFRDLEQIIGAIMPLMFFLSPVIYRPNQVGISQKIVWLNPFSYFISLIRSPIVGEIAPMFVYQIAIVTLIVGGFFTVYQFGKWRRRVAFWV